MMTLGEVFRVTLLGSSHGPYVGATIEGLPIGTKIDYELIQSAMNQRKPGGPFASKRKEDDVVTWESGIEDGVVVDEIIRCIIPNNDVRSTDYDFLPNQPRPGHQDMVMQIKSKGEADLRGGGTSSARMTAPLVAASALVKPLLKSIGIVVEAHVSDIGSIQAKPMHLCPPRWASDVCEQLRCRDPDAASKMAQLIQNTRSKKDSIGSCVRASIEGLPIGVGEPWFDGIEPALSRALFAIPAVRGVEFGHGFEVVEMNGSEHNSPWGGTAQSPKQTGSKPDGGLAGISTGSDLHIRIAFKPPSSIAKPQSTLNLETNQIEELVVKGRHDPVLGPRAAPVVEAMCNIVLYDLCIRGGFL
jgi:chorismate synthase